MILRKPTKLEFQIYKKLEIEFYNHHKSYGTLLQDISPEKRDLESEFKQLINERKSFFRFLENDSKNVVGYIYGFVTKAGPNEKQFEFKADLNSLIVLKKFRNKGYAKYMVNEFFKWLKLNNVHYVEASCNIKNDQIIKFNKLLGFKEQHMKFGKIL